MSFRRAVLATLSLLAVAAAEACAAPAAGPASASSSTPGAPAFTGPPVFPPVPAELLGKPNWSGVYYRLGSPTDPTYTGALTGGAVPPESAWPPLTPEYRRRYRAIADAYNRGERLSDPTANCLPAGFPWMMNMPYPMELHQTPQQITIIAEWVNQTRRIYIGDKAHPEDLEPSYFGHSIGRWEGDTLVVDTVGLRADTNLNDSGLPHSDQMHVVERWTMTPQGVLEDVLTVNDPKALTEPWTRTFRYRNGGPGFRMMEYVCENNRDAVDLTKAGDVLSKTLGQP